MKRLLPFFLVISTFLSFSQTVNVMTFNMRDVTLNDPSPNDWISRLPRCVTVINNSNPGVIGLQEATGSQIGDLLSDLPNYSLAGSGTHTVLFYDKTKYKVIENGAFWLSETPDISGSIGWDAIYERVCTWAIFEDLNTGKSFYGFNTHYSHVGANARLESSKLIAQRIADRTHPEFPFFFTGDFNAAEGSSPINYLQSDVNNPVKMNDSYRDIHPNEVNSGTYHYYSGTKTENKIDYVFAETGTFTTTSADIIHYNENGNYPTDHYPVEAVIKFNEATTPVLNISPISVTVLMPHGDALNAETSIHTIKNIGTATLPTLTATPSDNWIDISFDTQEGNDRELNISINENANELEAGIHQTTILISGQGVDSKTITINLNIHTGCITNDEFKNNDKAFLPSNSSFTHSENGGAWTIATTGHDQWDVFGYTLNDGINSGIYDFTQEGVLPQIKIRARASSNALLRLTLQESDGTRAQNGTLNGINTFELTTEYQEFTIELTGHLWDEYAGGGTLDQSKISSVLFSVNPGWVAYPITGEYGTYDSFFDGTINIDYIQVGAGCPTPDLLTSIFKSKEVTATNYAYPNPANDVLYLTNTQDVTAISILNLQGELIIELGEPTESIDISSLQSGSYYLRIIKGGEILTEGVVIY